MIPVGSLGVYEDADLVIALSGVSFKIVKSHTPLRVVVIGADGTILKEKVLGQ